MKKMLIKAVALSLVMGGVGFAANDALAAPIPGIPSETDIMKANINANAQKILQNQKDIAGLKGDVATNKDNITLNKELAARALSTANKALIDGKIADVQIREDMKKADDANTELATRALGTANKALIDGKIADVQIREDMKKADAKLDAKIDTEATARKNEDKKLQAQINKNGIKADTALKVIGNGAMQNGATNLTDGVNQNTRLVEAEAKARDDADKAEAKAREEADTKLQNNINAEATTRENAVNTLNSRIDQVGSDATKGIAKASALAALHPLDYDPDNKFDIAAAGGFYKGENAFALGAFYRPNRNVMLSMGTTLTSGDNAYNVGLTFKIGKSGKHTEAGLTTADLYAMIGAMQDKMDQQQKKIEELEAKQAK